MRPYAGPLWPLQLVSVLSGGGEAAVPRLVPVLGGGPVPLSVGLTRVLITVDGRALPPAVTAAEVRTRRRLGYELTATGRLWPPSSNRKGSSACCRPLSLSSRRAHGALAAGATTGPLPANRMSRAVQTGRGCGRYLSCTCATHLLPAPGLLAVVIR